MLMGNPFSASEERRARNASSDGAQHRVGVATREDRLHLGMGAVVTKIPEAVPLMRVLVRDHAMLA